jgi:cbb3-type cytochrome oxidase subunit 1
LLANRLIYTAVAFFVVGVSLGIYMGANKDFRFTHVHVHINLLGWVALGLIGLLYSVYPRLQQSWLARSHYWLHTIGLIVFMGGFAWGTINGVFATLPVASGATMVGVGVLMFAIHVFSNLRHAQYRGAS